MKDDVQTVGALVYCQHNFSHIKSRTITAPPKQYYYCSRLPVREGPPGLGRYSNREWYWGSERSCLAVPGREEGSGARTT